MYSFTYLDQKVIGNALAGDETKQDTELHFILYVFIGFNLVCTVKAKSLNIGVLCA
jgi:hypothetical protein